MQRISRELRLPIERRGGSEAPRQQVGARRPIPLQIRKSTGAVPTSGTYTFSVTCSGPGGPYTGPNPVQVTLPGAGVVTVNVPFGSLCLVKETVPAGNWSNPVFSGSGVPVAMGKPWEAQVGPVTAAGGVVTVTNRASINMGGPDAPPTIGQRPTRVPEPAGEIIGQRPTLLVQPTTLTVTKTIVPASATGTFRLMIDGFTAGTGGNVGNGGTTGAVSVEPITHLVSETASPGTNSADYIAVIGGDCDPTGHVTVASRDAKTCTITNTLKVSHGTWTQGPGTAVFTVCAYGTTCDLNGAPGASVTITVEAWGGGGGGGSGYKAGTSYGGPAGGGGGYGTTTITTTVPTGGTTAFYVGVGSGGAGGLVDAPYQQAFGGSGGFSEVRFGHSAGAFVVKATGGTGGEHGHGGGGVSGASGAGGTGTVNNWGGSAGTDGAVGTGCNGGGGGMGGAGGGPGRTGPGYINDGGNGGHGGYLHSLFLPTCTAQSANNGRAPGMPGEHGRVRFVW